MAKNQNVALIVANLYKNDSFADVTFVLRNRSGELINIPANKNILASLSPKFKEMFAENQMATNTAISDTSAEAFDEFLQLFYLTDVKLTVENLTEVCKLIEEFDVPQFYGVCESFIEQTVTPDVVFQYFELVLSLNLTKVIPKLYETIRKDPATTLKFIGECGEIVLKTMLESNELVFPEVDILKAAILWASESLTKKCLSASPLNIRAELGESMHLIRFPVMEADQFINSLQKYPNLLNYDEYVGILQYITSREPLSPAVNFSTVPRKPSPSASADEATNTPKIDNLAKECPKTMHIVFDRNLFDKKLIVSEKSIIGVRVDKNPKNKKIFLSGFAIRLGKNADDHSDKYIRLEVDDQVSRIPLSEFSLIDIAIAETCFCQLKSPIPIVNKECSIAVCVEGARAIETCMLAHAKGDLQKYNVELTFPYKGGENRLLSMLNFIVE